MKPFLRFNSGFSDNSFQDHAEQKKRFVCWIITDDRLQTGNRYFLQSINEIYTFPFLDKRQTIFTEIQHFDLKA